MFVATAPWIRTKLGVPTWSVIAIVPLSVSRLSPSVIVPVTIAWM